MEIKNLKKIKPRFNNLITTAAYRTHSNVTDSGIILQKAHESAIDEFQKVVAIGDAVRGIKEGDIVKINFNAYGVKKHQDGSMRDGVITDNPYIRFEIPTIKLDGFECLFLTDRDIEFVVEEYE